MTLPLWCGNQVAGMVRVTSMIRLMEKLLRTPYTRYRLSSPALIIDISRYCRYQ